MDETEKISNPSSLLSTTSMRRHQEYIHRFGQSVALGVLVYAIGVSSEQRRAQVYQTKPYGRKTDEQLYKPKLAF